LDWLKSDEARTRANQLRSAISDLPGLKVLASNPLLLTMMALLHTWRGQLPEDRVELYGDIIRLLLERWETARLGDADRRGLLALLNVPTLKLADLEKALQKVVFLAHHGQRTDPTRAADVREADLVSVVRPLLLDDPARAQIFVDFIRDRSGLLLWDGRTDELGSRLYSLPHRTFQEYLAGAYLAGRREFPQLVAQLARQEHQRWREVILLAVGKAARDGYPDLALDAVEALCPSQTPADDADWRNVWLAGEALPEVGRAASVIPAEDDGVLEAMGLTVQTPSPSSVALRERVCQRLVTLLETGALPPVERAAAGRALAAIGDPRPGVTILPPSRGEPRGGTFPDILWCPVPGGPFTMGSPDDSLAWPGTKETPQHSVELPPFLISRYPITNAQFQTFVDDPDGYSNSAWWTRAGIEWRGDRGEPEKYGGAFDLPNHPVVGVTWYEAVAYCKWANEQIGKLANEQMENLDLRSAAEGGWRILVNGESKGVEALGDKAFGSLVDVIRHSSLVLRLPTEAEWEKAARGDDGRVYPWGNDFDPDKCNAGETGIGTTSAVGLFPDGASPCGALDLSGNVLEWCATRWQEEYPLPRVDEWSDDYLSGTSPRVWRGGAFVDLQNFARGAGRYGLNPDYWGDDLGFRVVAGASSWQPLDSGDSGR
ncbi:MAG: SUMF1/EgtB/PvdO family nonheme iron enzyme, partial [Anaerolineae bacterium]